MQSGWTPAKAGEWPQPSPRAREDSWDRALLGQGSAVPVPAAPLWCPMPDPPALEGRPWLCSDLCLGWAARGAVADIGPSEDIHVLEQSFWFLG